MGQMQLNKIEDITLLTRVWSSMDDAHNRRIQMISRQAYYHKKRRETDANTKPHLQIKRKIMKNEDTQFHL